MSQTATGGGATDASAKGDMEAGPAPPEVLHFRVCHKGGVRLRASPTDNPGPDSTVLPEGTIVKAHKLPVEQKGLQLVQICEGQSYTGFLPITAKGYTALEIVPGERDEQGAWWYRVVATDGMHFAKEPRLDSPRHEAVHPNGTIIKAVRQLIPAGSLVMFVELEDDQGWIFAATNGGELLERYNGKPVVEATSPEERTVGECYFRVLHKAGLRIREAADVNAKDIGELLMHNKVFNGSEVYRPPGVDNTFVRLKDDRGWVCVVRNSLLAGEALSPPESHEGDFWFQVNSAKPAPVMDSPSPTALTTGKQMGLGMIFGSRRKVKPLGCADTFVELNTQQVNGWVKATGQLKLITEPLWQEGPFFYQVLHPGGLRVRINPHANSNVLGEIIPPYSVIQVEGTLDVVEEEVAGAEQEGNGKATPAPTPAVAASVGDGGAVQHVEAAVAPSSAASAVASKPSVFLRLAGRQGWLMTVFDGKEVVRRIDGTPTIEHGSFVYRVLNDKTSVRHGPTASSPMLDMALDQGYELTARLRLRPYNTDEVYVCFDHKMPAGLRRNKTVPGWLSVTDENGTALITEVSSQVDSVTEGQSTESLSEDKAPQEKGDERSANGKSSEVEAKGNDADSQDDGVAKEQDTSANEPPAATAANGAKTPPRPPAQEKQRRGWLW